MKTVPPWCKIVVVDGFPSTKKKGNMSITALFQQAHLLQSLAVALSIFNLIAFLWLACTVWLNGDRQSMIARVGVIGLGLSALFFFIHALLVSAPLSQDSGLFSTDFLWHLIWLPALGVPYIWFIIGLYYAVLMNEKWRHQRPILLFVSALLGCCVLSLLIANRRIFTFRGTLLLLGYGDTLGNTDVGLFSPIIWLPVLFLFYVTFCASGPWFTPSRMGRLLLVLWSAMTGRAQGTESARGAGSVQNTGSAQGAGSAQGTTPAGKGSLRHRLADAFWTDQVSIEELEEPELSWHMARPGLLLAALLMVGLTFSLGAVGVLAILHWLASHEGGHELSTAKLNTVPVNLLGLDIYATGLVAVVVLLIGYSIVRHGILIERPLARRGFFEQWRGIVIVATTIAIFIALLVELTGSSLGSLLIITSLATGTYALFTWSSYTAHDRYIALLAPFLRSTNVRHWLNTDLHKTEQSMETLFSHLCQEVLEVRCASLVLLSGPVRRSFTYQWSILDRPEEIIEQDKARAGQMQGVGEAKALGRAKGTGQAQGTGQGQALSAPTMDRNGGAYRIRMTLQGLPTICWVLPLYDELGLVAKLYLGPRKDSRLFTDEDMDLAQACGQRILDTLRDHEAMLAVSGLLRRRIVDVKLLGAQQRRILHDEILPLLHLALLRMESVRTFTKAIGTVGVVPNACGTRDRVGARHDPYSVDPVPHTNAVSNTDPTATAPQPSEYERADQSLDDAISSISTAHRRLASMMRAMATSSPHRLERDGVMHAIRSMLEQDFQHAFDEVKWCVSDETARRVDDAVPPAIAELIFAAVQEVLRNAARHARGTDLHRRLCLTLSASYQPHLEVTVADDGVGIVSASSSTTGTGGGLLTHSALLAIVGGSLAVKSNPDKGVTVRIFVPVESLC
jgi:signal transduction histidine kinase